MEYSSQIINDTRHSPMINPIRRNKNFPEIIEYHADFLLIYVQSICFNREVIFMVLCQGPSYN